MKSGFPRNRIAIVAAFSLIGSICGFHSNAAGPDPAAPPTSAPVAARLPTTDGPSQFELESHFFVVDERDIDRLPEAVRRRLSAFEGRNANRTERYRTSTARG